MIAGREPSRRLVLLSVALGYLAASWAMNPVSSVLPTISASLEIDVTRASWILNAYFVLLVGWVLIAGRLGDALGLGLVFRAGCLLFAGGSLLAFTPGGYVALLLGRAVQGFGSALLFGTSLAIVATVYQGRQLGWAVGAVTLSAAVSSMFGTWLNTSLVQQVDWHWTFLPPAMAGVLAAVFAGRLPSVRRAPWADVDWAGGTLLFLSLTTFLLGLNHLHEGPETYEQGAPYHLSMHVASLVLFAAFIYRQLYAARPLLDLRLFRRIELSAGLASNGLAHSSMLATSLLIPFLLERGRGYSPSETQQLLLAQQSTYMVASLAGGWLYARHGSGLLSVSALAVLAAGLMVMGWLAPSLPFAAIFPLVMLLGGALAIFTTTNNSSVMATVPGEHRGFAAGMLETTRQLGHSLGVSISSTLLAGSLAIAATPREGFAQGFTEAASAMGVVSALGATMVLLVLVRQRQAERVARTAVPVGS